MKTAIHLTGLQKLCRLYGRMKCGDKMMVWDYSSESAVPESKMPMGGNRWKRSEKAKWKKAKEENETNP